MTQKQQTFRHTIKDVYANGIVLTTVITSGYEWIYICKQMQYVCAICQNLFTSVQWWVVSCTVNVLY